jgi:predicted glycosyltransferase involved in capsule biosynthesis
LSLLTVVASNRDRLDPHSNISKWFVKSLKNQKFKDFDIFIADGGSSNYEEIKEWLEDIDINIDQLKIGEAFERARLNNFGIRNAKTPYVLCTDVDMFFGPDFLSNVNEELKENVMVESRTMYWKKPISNQIYQEKINPFEELDKCRIGRIKKRTSAGGCQCMHINNWKKLTGYNENMIGWGSEDVELLKRVHLANIKVKWIGESRESIQLFHQPHPKIDIHKDLEYQEENKKIFKNSKNFKVNNENWGI